MNGPGSMHSKLQLLKYPDYLRIAIPTGNLVAYDWGESGVMENVSTLKPTFVMIASLISRLDGLSDRSSPVGRA